MNMTASKASTIVWTAVASLFVVLALGAAYFVFFTHHPSPREQACQRLKQPKTSAESSHDLTIDEAVCSGVAK